MSYLDTLLKVNTAKALELLKLSITQSGAYIYYPWPDCQGKAVVKAYGEKKCLTYCTDLFDCVRRWEIGEQAICNFGLPYLSATHLDLLNRLPNVEFLVSEERKKEFAIQALELKTWYKF